MKNKFIYVFTALLCLTITANAQSFQKQQASQERTIKAVYKRGRITANEYYKLMKEQDHIKYAIQKYDADGIWTPHEKNVVFAKLQKAEDRLRRYKTNGEVY